MFQNGPLLEAEMDEHSKSESMLEEYAAWSEIRELPADAPREQRIAKMKCWSAAKRRRYEAKKQLLVS
jgi:hypothetical protein